MRISATYSDYDVPRSFGIRPSDGQLLGCVPRTSRCASAGDTEEEARANMREAIELYLAPAEIDLPENAKLVEVTVG